MSVAPDIRAPAAADAAWFTRVLAANGIEARVSGVRAEPIGTGQIGDSVRFALDYAHAPPGAPTTLVGKFPAAGEDSRSTGVALGNYWREVRFYQRLAPTARVATPRAWFAEVDEASGDFTLIMDDLAPARPGDQLKGVTLEQAREVIVQAARLHASFWDDDALDDMPWVSGSRVAPPSGVTPERVLALWEAFKARFAGRLDPRWADVGDRLVRGEAHPPLIAGHPRCLTHNDFRPDNMMFATPEGGAPVTVLDWQSYALGAGPTDVAYFLAGALPVDVRRAAEPELLDLYHRTLSAEGVEGYDPALMRRQYAQGARQLFLTAFFAAMIVTPTERGDRMFIQMLGSAAEHMLEHGALE